MRKSAPLAALCVLLAAHPAFAEEDPQAAYAIESFKKFVAAAKAKDGGIGHFISAYDWAPLAKSGKTDELVARIIAAAEKEGAKFSYKKTEVDPSVLSSEILIEPDGVRVPIKRSGDLWILDAKTLAGEVEVSEDEQTTFLQLARFFTNLNNYKGSAGFYPTTEQGLQALAVKPTTDPVPGRWFRLQSEIAKDPWGNDFVYKATKDGYTLRSLGPDGTESADDLVSPF